MLLEDRQVKGVIVCIVVVIVAFFALKYFSFNLIQSPDLGANDPDVVTLPDASETDYMKEIERVFKKSLNSGGTLSELIIQDISAGEGRGVEVGDTISVHYVGTLTNGTEFDSSYKRGEEFRFEEDSNFGTWKAFKVKTKYDLHPTFEIPHLTQFT